jgi:hypothetical protein
MEIDCTTEITTLCFSVQYPVFSIQYSVGGEVFF